MTDSDINTNTSPPIPSSTTTTTTTTNTSLNVTTTQSIGLDLGALATTMSLATSEQPQSLMMRNKEMNVSTPSIVSFTPDGRMFGQAASNTMSSSIVSFSNMVDLLSSDDVLELKHLQEKLPSIQIVAMFLEHLLGGEQKNEEGKKSDLIFALPRCVTNMSSIRDALKIAKLDQKFSPKCCTIGVALAGAHFLKHGKTDTPKRHVLIVDHGYNQLTVALIRVDKNRPHVVVEKCVRDAANKHMDLSLFQHFQDETSSKYGVKPELDSKLGKRLLKACVKAKKTLSAVKDTAFMVDCVKSSTDARYKCDRNLLSRVCAAQLKCLEDTVRSVLQEASVNDVDAVEMVGGGSRSPIIVDAIKRAFVGADVKIQYTLDIKNSVSQGAAFLSAIEYGWYDATNEEEKDEEEKNTKEDGDTKEEEKEDTTSFFLEEEEEEEEVDNKQISSLDLTKALELELKIKKHNEQCRIQLQQKNDFETFIYKWRDVCENVDSPHYDKVDKEFLESTLDREESWFFEEGVSSGSKCADRLMTLRKEVETKMSLYIDAEKQDKLKREAELRAQEAKEKATEDAKDPDQTDDFDRRKMPTKKRIRMAKKNKDEANELFKGKNYVPATKRYIKALRHCEKCFDMNPGEKDEVSKLTLSIRLNLAMSWLKLEKYERAIENATKALELDAKSAKALYRRACCYEKLKKWDEAFRDVKKVLKIKPEDKSSLKLQSRIMKVLAKQKAKAKRMAKKMFG